MKRIQKIWAEGRAVILFDGALRSFTSSETCTFEYAMLHAIGKAAVKSPILC